MNNFLARKSISILPFSAADNTLIGNKIQNSNTFPSYCACINLPFFITIVSGSPSRSYKDLTDPPPSSSASTNHNLSLDSLSTHSSSSSTGHQVGVANSTDHTPTHVKTEVEENGEVKGVDEQVEVVQIPFGDQEAASTPDQEVARMPIGDQEVVHAPLNNQEVVNASLNDVGKGREEDGEFRPRVPSGTVLKIPEWNGHILVSTKYTI